MMQERPIDYRINKEEAKVPYKVTEEVAAK